MIKMEDIHSGYLVETRDGKLMLCTRVNQKKFTKIFCTNYRWIYASCYDEDMMCKNIVNGKRLKEYDIVKVYGLVSDSSYYCNSGAPFSTQDVLNCKDGRPLLWERKPTMRLTMSELCELLKAEVEIVSED